MGKEYEKKLDVEEYVVQQSEVIDKCVEKLRDGGSICWEIGNFVDNGEIVPLDILLYDSFKKHKELKLRNRIVWTFGHGLHCSKRFSGRYETILWFTKGDDYTFNLDAVRVPQKYPGKRHFKGPNAGEFSCHPEGKNPADVWDIPNVKANHVEKTCHPCQFPIALIQRLVLALTNTGDTVYDPFLGVGTTAVAAVINKRKVAGSEILEKYYEIATERVKQAQDGTLKFRPDIPVYKPTGNLTILENPFKEQICE